MPRRPLALLLVAPLLAADWPRFHGPNGQGVADPGAPVDLSKAVPAWKTQIPGSGHASPVVAGGKIYLQTSSADARTLVCLDAATGKELWVRGFPGGPGHTHKKNTLASGTAAVDGDRVFVLAWDGDAVTLHAVGTDGKPLWGAPLGGYVSQHGAGLSPVAAGGKVFVNYDQDGRAELFAFDAATGAKVWSKDRKAFRACSGSPLLRDLPGGKRELLVVSTSGATGYDPDTGNVNWNWDWDWKGGMALRTVGSPLLVGDTLFAAAGDGGGSRAMVGLKLGAKPKLLWEKKKGTPYVPTPVAHGGHLYWVGDDGVAACAKQSTGEVVWSERAFSKAVSASLLIAGDAVLAVSESGQAVTFAASPDGWEKRGEYQLNDAVFASPAAADGRVYLRGKETLYCFGAR